MTTDKDQEFIQAAKAVLDATEQQLDAGTRARLREARQRALGAHEQRRWWRRADRWMPAGALATGVAALAVAAYLWFSLPPADMPPTGMEDLELLATQDSIDFYADLDFYHWLTTQDAG